MHPDPAGSGEFGHQAFATEQARLPTTGLADRIFDGVVEGDNVAGIKGHDFSVGEARFDDCTTRRKQNVTVARALQQNESLATEERLASAPLRVHVDGGI